MGGFVKPNRMMTKNRKQKKPTQAKCKGGNAIIDGSLIANAGSFNELRQVETCHKATVVTAT